MMEHAVPRVEVEQRLEQACIHVDDTKYRCHINGSTSAWHTLFSIRGLFFFRVRLQLTDRSPGSPRTNTVTDLVNQRFDAKMYDVQNHAMLQKFSII